MTPIARALAEIRSTLPADGSVELVAVSKFQPVEAVAEAYAAGQRTFGESRVQELLAKQAALPSDIHWHFIGHLQTNKVKALVGRADLIESVDSLRLLELIDSCSEKAGVTTRVLLEVHVAMEETKTGFTPDEIEAYFASGGYRNLRATHICGLMGMATNTEDPERIRGEFELIASLADKIRRMCPDLRGFDTLSMGMSDDYPLAIGAGATHIRIGTRIFGSRC